MRAFNTTSSGLGTSNANGSDEDGRWWCFLGLGNPSPITVQDELKEVEEVVVVEEVTDGAAEDVSSFSLPFPFSLCVCEYLSLGMGGIR